MKEYFAEQFNMGDSKQVVEWFPAVAAGLSGYFVPILLEKLTDREDWDFAEERLWSSLFKNYWCSIFNILVFIYIQYLALNKSVTEDNAYNCIEDQLTDNLIKLWIFEIVFRYIFYLYWNIHWKVKSMIFKDCEYRQEFEVNDELVWHLYFLCVTWVTQLFLPIMALISVPIMYLHTLFLIHRLYHQKRQPDIASNNFNIGKTMMSYLTITFIITLSWYCLILFWPLDRHPFYNFEKKQFNS